MPESTARRRSENAAAERREARRSASWAGDLRRSGDRPDREAGHGVRRFRTKRLSAFCSPHFFFGSGKRTRGTRPHPVGPAERWLFDMRIGNSVRANALAQRKAPAGRAGGREVPDLRGDEEAWSREGRRGRIGPAKLGRVQPIVIRSVVANPDRRIEAALLLRRHDRRRLDRGAGSCAETPAPAAAPLVRTAHQDCGRIAP